MPHAELSPIETRALHDRLTGSAIGPSDADWDDARRAWNLHIDQRPAIVVVPRTVADVQAAVAFARARGLRVAPQGTGHNASALGSLEGTMLVKLHEMKDVEIDVPRRTFRAEAGVVWLEVTSRLTGTGLVPPLGSSPDVGLIGYTLGGGFCWLGRKHGLAANAVVAIEIVLADGTFVRATADDHPDLFWALRGGGGNFGVVTAIEMQLFHEPDVYGTTLFFDPERGAEVLSAWSRYVDTLDVATTSYAVYMAFPPIPEVPEPIRGQAYVLVKVLHFGPEADGHAIAEPMRALGPQLEMAAMMDAEQLSHFAGDPEEPMPIITGAHVMLDELTPEAIDAIVAHAGPGSGTPFIAFEIRHLEGALRRVPANAGAARNLPAKFLTIAIGVPQAPGDAEALEAHAAKFEQALVPHESGRRYLNFTEVKHDTRAMFERDAHARLAAIRAAYDPHGLLRSNHEIDAAPMSEAA